MQNLKGHDACAACVAISGQDYMPGPADPPDYAIPAPTLPHPYVTYHHHGKDVPGPDPKGAAGLLKTQLQLIPPAFNVEVAKALQNGSSKYGPWNWRQSRVEVMTYIGAMRRHIDAFLNGEDIDPDSGAHHLGCVAASAAIVIDAAQFGSLIDNRPPVSTGAYEGFKSNYFASKEEFIKSLNDFKDKLRAKAPGTSASE